MLDTIGNAATTTPQPQAPKPLIPGAPTGSPAAPPQTTASAGTQAQIPKPMGMGLPTSSGLPTPGTIRPMINPVTQAPVTAPSNFQPAPTTATGGTTASPPVSTYNPGLIQGAKTQFAGGTSPGTQIAPVGTPQPSNFGSTTAAASPTPAPSAPPPSTNNVPTSVPQPTMPAGSNPAGAGQTLLDGLVPPFVPPTTATQLAGASAPYQPQNVGTPGLYMPKAGSALLGTGVAPVTQGGGVAVAGNTPGGAVTGMGLMGGAGIPASGPSATPAAPAPTPATIPSAPGPAPSPTAAPSSSALGPTSSAGAAPSTAQQLTPYGPGNDLQATQINLTPGAATQQTGQAVSNLAGNLSNPDVYQQAAQQSFNTFAQQSDPAYQAAIRQATAAAAANGGIGSGQLSTSYGNLANQRNLQLEGMQQQAQQAALTGQAQYQLQQLGALQGVNNAQFGQNVAQTGQLNQQQQYQTGMNQQAIQNAAQQAALQAQLQGQQFNENMGLYNAGFGGSPYSALLNQGNFFGQQAATGNAQTQQLAANQALNQALQGLTPGTTPPTSAGGSYFQIPQIPQTTVGQNLTNPLVTPGGTAPGIPGIDSNYPSIDPTTGLPVYPGTASSGYDPYAYPSL